MAPRAAYTTIPLPCAAPGDSAEALAGPGACTLDAFRALAGPAAINSTQDWCSYCQNDDKPVCQLQAATRQLQAAQSDAAPCSSGGSGLSSGAVVGLVIGCVALVAVVFAALFAVHHRRMKRQLKQAQVAATYSDAVTA